MGDYDLSRLGTAQFEQLTQALAVKHLGPGVRVYGAGRDGGRESTTDRPVQPPGGGSWTGYSVLQAKFRARPGMPQENAVWLRNEIRKELDAWTDRSKNRQPKPDNLLFVSNVHLSAVPDHGVDHVLAIRDHYAKKLPLRAFEVWHYDHLCRLLDDSADVRAAYAGLITPGDVLVQLHRMLTGQAADLGNVLRRHAAKELIAEQWVRLGQAGSKTNDKLPLGRVAVDLAAERHTDDGPVHVAAVSHVLARGNRILRLSERQCDDPPSPHMVLVGGPGQGKTTLAQLMCQAYRAALLADAHGLGPDVASAVSTLADTLRATGLPVPAARRWPFKVDLSKYADVLAGAPETALVRYIADRVTERAAETVTASQIAAWIKSWPCLLVLDGLDEVAAPHVREALVDRVQDLLIDAAAADADLLLVATTRPRGYSGEFTPDRYEHLSLTDMSRDAALAYARRLADVRHNDDPDMHAHVLDRIAEAADADLTARLMRTPLQITIMSLLLEGRSRVPQHRHGLFDAYYDTIYARETGKSTAAARLLEQHRSHVDALHDRVGLLLQVQAETDGHSDPAVPLTDLRGLVLARLAAQEYDPADADTLADRIVSAATDRLVLLVPKNDKDVGFEVRSLQEFLAARALVNGREDVVLARLRRLAASAHWRNTWLLAAGRVATRHEHLVERLISVVTDLDAEDDLAMHLAPGAELAIDLLDDGFAATSPRAERLLLKQAVDLLRRPVDPSTIAAADTLHRISVEGRPRAARHIGETAAKSLGGEPPDKITAAVALRLWANRVGVLGTLGQRRVPSLDRALGRQHQIALALHFVGFTSSAAPPKDAPLIRRGTLADALPPAAGLSPEDAHALDQLRTELDRVTVHELRSEEGSPPVSVVRHLRRPEPSTLHNALHRPAVSERYAEAILNTDSNAWAVASALTTIAREWTQRRPVGVDLLVLMDSD